ncbi:MAG: leucine-rich repeat domain-containing protein [Butyricicoccus porcorum]
MKQHQTLRRGFSVLLSLAMCLTLLPATALAEGSEIKICGTTLEEGKAYAPNAGGIVEKTDETDYLEYNAGELTVRGSVTVALPSSSADNVLKLESGDLTINCPEGSSLTLDGENSSEAAVLLGDNSTLTLTGAGDVTIQGSETAVSGGTLKAENYSGDLAISVSDTSNSAMTAYKTVLNLDTTGNITITGSKPIANGSFTVTNAEDVTITGSMGDMLPNGSSITATGNVSIESESNMVVTNLTVNNAEKVTLTGNTNGPVAMSVTLNGCESWDIINKSQTSTAPWVVGLTVDGTPYGGNCYGVTVTDDGNGTASASLPVASAGTNITLSATPDRGYRFKEWQVTPDTVTINDNQFTMPGANVTVTAVFESIPSVDVAIDEAFPDEKFREYVKTNIDTSGDGYLDSDEINEVKSINVYGKGIKSLTGIKHFTELKTLNCYENNLTTLDLSNNKKLERLDCGNNQLTELNVESNTALTYLSCYSNQLTELNVENNTELTFLSCHSNQLTSLDLENTKLGSLYAHDNSYEITLTDGKFDLTELESFGFDVSKATDWNGGTVEGNTLTVNSNAVRVTYKYNCGKNKTVTFTLSVKGTSGNGDGVPIDDKKFPDTVFREYVSKFDTNNDDALNEAEIAAVKEINVYGDDVQDLTGIEHFTALEKLYCDANFLKALDVSKNKALTYLDCGENDLTTLDVSENKDLEELVCRSNDLTELKLSNNTALKVLNCRGNQLTSLDVSKNTALTKLDCFNNNLTSLNLSKNSALTSLSADNNTYAITLTGGTFDLDKLSKFGFDASKATDWNGGTVEGNTLTVNSDTVTYKYDCGNDKDFVTFTLLPGIAIDTTNFPDKTFREYVSDNFDENEDGVLSDEEIAKAESITCNYHEISNLKGIEHFTALTALNCSNNKLTNLDVSNNKALEYLNCSGNQLTELEVDSNTALKTLDCGSNFLTKLDVSSNTALEYLYCSSNFLTKLEVSDLTELTELICSGNPLTSLNVSQNHNLETLYCSSCALTSLDLSDTNVTGQYNLSAAYNSYDITLTDGTFDLDELIEFGFKASKATDWTGGTVDENGILTLNAGETKVTYKYDCENGHSVIFTLDATPKYTVTASGFYEGVFGNETGAPFTLYYAAGEKVDMLIAAREGYTLESLTLSGISEDDIEWNTKEESSQRIITFTMPEKNVTVTVNWTANGSGEEGGGGSSSGGGGTATPKYSVTAPENIENGTVTISPKNTSAGSKVTVTVTPDEGFALESLVIKDENGKEIKLTDNGNGKYTFTMPSGKVTVEASFKAETAEPVEPAEPAKSVNPFTDVPIGAYYEDAVIWAVEKGITSGTTETTFSPDASCTRAQMLTFMWRAAGSPKASGSNPFTDVSADAYYYDAVLWAVENGITSGISATTFAPDATVTRDQTVTFLYRMAGSPAANGSSFSDVSSDAYYADAVAWAVQQNITSGTGDNQFSPNADCTRAQIVTFLYRYMG